MQDYSNPEFLDCVPYVTRYYNEYLQYYHMHEHHHDECEIMYISSGKCRVTVVDLYMGLTEKDDEHLPGGYGYNLVQVKQRITVMKTTMVPNISQPDLAKDCGTFPILTPVWQMVAAGFLR